MRIAGLIAIGVLVAGCSQSVGGEAEPSGAPPAASSSQASPTGAAPPTTRPPAAAPPPGAPVGDVIEWIEEADAVDPAEHHVAFRDGVTTQLGDDIAFTAPSGSPHDSTQCITDVEYDADALICLADLDSPTPRPDGAEGMWKPGWIEYTGTAMQVGALHGDPGPFIKGVGPELPAGRTLAFGDFRCRSDGSGLACVNYAHRSATWISAAGVVPYGCLQPATAPPGVGKMFSC
ncbi:hypothetical protein [Mycolicibacterium poriferae]|uniref:Lipoprotein LppI n=1 Tax=Mycolicibacterium poriferae TaxID=39694 RepID=A0A6N4VEK5_9MYCO|nr:hypothetical protein [Mycolicibacterium poriferae]MCV7264530.1 hypothetical protein [Mycolicibacterium poriferae]BBX52563.1 hypothetical protein MPOR_35890 [Mycolicibacterium poriferae]